MARYNVRCSKETCKLRYVFAKHPDDYKTPRKCAGCGGTRYRIIKNRARDRGKHELCTCAGYNWGDDWTGMRPPHRRGSRFCHYRADGTMRQPGDADFEDLTYDDYEANGIHELGTEPATWFVWSAPLSSATSASTGARRYGASAFVASQVVEAAHYRYAAVGGFR